MKISNNNYMTTKDALKQQEEIKQKMQSKKLTHLEVSKQITELKCDQINIKSSVNALQTKIKNNTNDLENKINDVSNKIANQKEKANTCNRLISSNADTSCNYSQYDNLIKRIDRFENYLMNSKDLCGFQQQNYFCVFLALLMSFVSFNYRIN